MLPGQFLGSEQASLKEMVSANSYPLFGSASFTHGKDKHLLSDHVIAQSWFIFKWSSRTNISALALERKCLIQFADKIVFVFANKILLFDGHHPFISLLED